MSYPTEPIRVSVHTEVGYITLKGLMSAPTSNSNGYNQPNYTHYSQSRDFYVEAEGVEEFPIRLDERNGNFLHDLYVGTYQNKYKKNSKKQKIIYDYIHEVFWIMKNSNPDYGTFDFKNSKRTGRDGKIPLYTHDFFAFFSNYCRVKKIDEILDDLEENPV